MELHTIINALICLFVFYAISHLLLNWLIINRGFKRINLDGDEFQNKLPLLVSGNLGLALAILNIHDSLFNFVTYQISDKSFINILTYSSGALLVNALIVLVSSSFATLITRFLFNIKNIYLKSILWFSFILITANLLNEYYVQYSTSNAFTIY